MKCHKCENEIPDESGFCPFCGAGVRRGADEQLAGFSRAGSLDGAESDAAPQPTEQGERKHPENSSGVRFSSNFGQKSYIDQWENEAKLGLFSSDNEVKPDTVHSIPGSYCTFCGKKRNPGAKFCTYCGKKLLDRNQPNISARHFPKFSKKGVTAIAVAAVLVICICVCNAIKSNHPWFALDPDGTIIYDNSGLGAVGLFLNGGVPEIPRELDQQIKHIDKTCQGLRELKYDGTVEQLVKYHSWVFNLDDSYDNIIVKCKDYTIKFHYLGEFYFTYYQNGEELVTYIDAVALLTRDNGNTEIPFQTISDLKRFVNDDEYHFRVEDIFTSRYWDVTITGTDLTRTIEACSD